MIRYLKIYKALMKINLIALFTYRANFINSTISSFFWGVFAIATIVLITSKTSTLFGWKREEIILLTAVYTLIVGIFHIFFARNFERFSRLMMWGQFDSVLLKPLDSQFSISFWELNYSAIIRVILGTLLLVYLIFSLSYVINLFNLILFLSFLIVGVVTLYTLWFFAASFLIWVPELSNIIELMYTVNGFTRYPPEMFKRVSGFLFIFTLPIVFVASSPFKTLIGRANYIDIFASFFICGLFLIISRFFWRFALRSYTSASN